MIHYDVIVDDKNRVDINGNKLPKEHLDWVDDFTSKVNQYHEYPNSKRLQQEISRTILEMQVEIWHEIWRVWLGDFVITPKVHIKKMVKQMVLAIFSIHNREKYINYERVDLKIEKIR